MGPVGIGVKWKGIDGRGHVTDDTGIGIGNPSSADAVFCLVDNVVDERIHLLCTLILKLVG